jgi:DNA-binding transcriptional LysR family regulator
MRSGTLVPLLQEFTPSSLPVSLAYLSQGPLPFKVRAFVNWSAPRLRA